MNRRNRLYLLFALIIALMGMVTGGVTLAHSPSDPPGPAGQPASKISPSLQQQFAAAAPGAHLKYWVRMADQADTRNNITDWAAKGWYVYNLLRAKADATQRPLLDQLSKLQAAGKVSSVESFWI